MLTVDDYNALPPAAADYRFAYGPGPEQFGDLFLPSTPGQLPVAILVHGGCWRAARSLTPLGPLARALNRDGIAVWNVEYRRVGNGGGWPETFEDVANGADFLRTRLRDFPLDLTRVVAVGHSAGGHLALWLAGRSRLSCKSQLYRADPLPLVGVVSLAGITNLARSIDQDLCDGMAAHLMKAAPEEAPAAYAQASPHALLPMGVRQVLINGDRDAIVPTVHVAEYVAQAQAVGDPVRLEVLAGMGHFEVVIPDSPAWPTVHGAVRGLVDG